jgi:large subunit ribosomal protein L28
MCGKRPVAGRKYAYRGLAKSKGGVGIKVTGVTRRRFAPNVQYARVREKDGRVHTVRVCAKCLKTALARGIFEKAARKPRPPRKVYAEPQEAQVSAREQDERDNRAEAEARRAAREAEKGGAREAAKYERGLAPPENLVDAYEDEKARESPFYDEAKVRKEKRRAEEAEREKRERRRKRRPGPR